MGAAFGTKGGVGCSGFGRGGAGLSKLNAGGEDGCGSCFSSGGGGSGCGLLGGCLRSCQNTQQLPWQPCRASQRYKLQRVAHSKLLHDELALFLLSPSQRKQLIDQTRRACD